MAEFLAQQTKIKKNYLVPDLKKKKIKNANNTILLNNLNHYRDFISMKDISEIIFFLFYKNYNGIINLGTGKKNSFKENCKNYSKKI